MNAPTKTIKKPKTLGEGKRGRPRGTGTRVVYEALREEILTLVARPGQHLDETQLEKRFKVSRTPIREALIRLQSDRLVQFSANRGHFVEAISFDDIPRVFEALDLFQAAVFRLAAIRRTETHLVELEQVNQDYWEAAQADDHKLMTEANHRFHVTVGRASDNAFLYEGYENVLNFNLRVTYLMFENANRASRRSETYYRQIFDEHNEMIGLLRRREADELDKICRQHTQLFCSRVVEFIEHRVELRTKAEVSEL